MGRVQSQRRASIDVGTNSVRLLVADVHPDGRVCSLVQRGTVTRLGEGLDATGRISDTAADRTLKAILEAVEEARATGAGPIVLAATSALRSATNGAQVSTEIERRTGLAVWILSGEEEARLVFRSVQGEYDDKKATIVMDIGGGSTEFGFGYGRDLKSVRSLSLGCVRLYERAMSHGGLESDSGYEFVRGVLHQAVMDLGCGFRDEYRGARIRGVGGTFTAFAMVHRGTPRHDPGSLEGLVLSPSEQVRVSTLMRHMPLEERRRWVGEGRADLVLAGAAILDEAVAFFEASDVQVSTHGLRFGLIHEAARRESPPRAGADAGGSG
jgi:exopolyphosphatase / guanosine-5'-triphosphate,3'-diphosphate pyrophosphatase